MADTLDVLTLTEAKRAINVESTWSTHETELELFVTGVSRRIDKLCGPVVQRAVTEWHDGGGKNIYPRETPVTSVTSVTEYVDTTATALTAETEATQPSDGYLLFSDGHAAVVWRRTSGSDTRFPSGRRRVKLVYVAGRAADTASVDAKFKLAAAAVLRRLWQREAGAWARGGDPFLDEGTGRVGFFKAVDPMVEELLGDELLPASQGVLTA